MLTEPEVVGARASTLNDSTLAKPNLNANFEEETWVDLHHEEAKKNIIVSDEDPAPEVENEYITHLKLR